MSTGLLETQNNLETRFSYVRDGIPGNYDVLHKMINLVRNSVVMDKGLESLVKDLLIWHDLDTNSDVGAIFNTLYEFVKSEVRYFQDPQGRIEFIKDARSTLQDHWGDCDDHAILNASILAMLGYSPKFVIAKYDNSDTSNFQHVYTVVYADGERFVFDTTLPFGSLNDEAATTEKREIDIFSYNNAVDGVSGIAKSVKELIRETGHNALNFTNTFAGVLPVGLLPAYALSFGSAMFGASNRHDKSLQSVASSISGGLTDLIIDLQNNRIALTLAQSRARSIAASLYAVERTEGDDQTFAYIEKQIKKKLAYIESYGQAPGVNSVSLNSNLMLALGFGAVGLGVLYLMNRK